MPTRLLALVLAVCALPASGQAQTSSIWQFANPNSKSLIGMDLRRIRQSGFGHFLDLPYLASLAGHLPGLDLLNQIETVLISSPGLAEDDESKEPPLLIVIQGHFELEKVRRILRDQGAKAQTFDSVIVYRPQGKAAREFGFALLDASTILAGDAQSVFSAIERRRLPAGEGANPAILRAQALSAASDLWAVMAQPGGLAEQILPLRAMGVTGLELGVSLSGGLALHGSLATVSESDARSLKEELKKILKVAGKGQPLAKKLKLDADGQVLSFSARIGQNEAEASLRTFLAKLRPERAVVAESQPVIPAKPQVIRIEGLDDGARELKYQPFP